MKNIFRGKDYRHYDDKKNDWTEDRPSWYSEMDDIRKHLRNEFSGTMWCEQMRYGGLVICPTLCPLPEIPFEVTEELEVFTVHHFSDYIPRYIRDKVPDETFVLDRGIYQIVMPKDQIFTKRGVYSSWDYAVHWIRVEKKTGEYMRVGISKGGCLETDVLIDQVDWRAVRRIKGD